MRNLLLALLLSIAASSGPAVAGESLYYETAEPHDGWVSYRLTGPDAMPANSLVVCTLEISVCEPANDAWAWRFDGGNSRREPMIDVQIMLPKGLDLSPESRSQVIQPILDAGGPQATQPDVRRWHKGSLVVPLTSPARSTLSRVGAGELLERALEEGASFRAEPGGDPIIVTVAAPSSGRVAGDSWPRKTVARFLSREYRVAGLDLPRLEAVVDGRRQPGYTLVRVQFGLLVAPDLAGQHPSVGIVVQNLRRRSDGGYDFRYSLIECSPLPVEGRRASPCDGMPQVLVPAGAFQMGSPPGEEGRQSDEGPQRTVSVAAFWMDVHEVTNAQYCRFLNAARPAEQERCRWVDLAGAESDPDRAAEYGRSQLESVNGAFVPAGGQERHPVTWVSWEGAMRYARWAGRTLPTEAQWERAARGGRQARYVWGDSSQPPQGAGNLADETTRRRWPHWAIFRGYTDYCEASAPVGSFEPNPFGLCDMAGNVWEWCLDYYERGWYARMPERNPCNSAPASYRVRRGGSWAYYPVGLRVARRLREAPEARLPDVGFRCVADP